MSKEVNWQQECLKKGFEYVREPDDHYVVASPAEMVALLRDLLGVDVRTKDCDSYGVAVCELQEQIDGLVNTLHAQQAERDALLAERDALQAFANEIVSGAFEGGSFDGGDIQDIGVKHGLLRIEQRDDECGEACACREYGFPSECYRKTELLGFAALQGAQP